MFIPAAPGMSKDLIEEINDALALVNSRSTRPDLKSAGHAGKYRPIEYVSDGHGLIVLKAPELLRYGLAQKAVNSDDELKAYFGAQSLQRLRVTWSEGLVRFLTNPFVRGFLIVVFLVALFAEMSHPGATVPGIIAAVALISLIVPPALVDMASWWEILAILSGLILLGIEVFVLPGFGVCGALGLILLFGGLIGTFVNQGSGLFPNTPQQTRDLTWGVSTVLVAFMVSGVALVFLWRSLPNLPLFGRLIHQDATGKEHEGLLEAMMSGPSPVKVGDQGVSLSPLRPSGRAQFGDQIVDAHADSGMIDPGAQIKVIRVEGLRIVVEQA
jgi:membrane-bound serine protease (ClpP class)